jgi:hypothetical protein
MMKPLWWVPILMCFVAGIVFLIPVNNAAGPTLMYDSLVPLAPISSILMWIIGVLIYMLGRYATNRPLRPM